MAVVAGVCDAAEALHHANAAHGAISPRSILIAPSVPRPTPVLLQLVAPTSGAYSTPERLLGQGPTADDDVWALHASLYAALTGSAPFEGTTKEALVRAMTNDQRKPLSDFGIDEPTLQALLDRGLDGDSKKRTRSVRELKQGLHDWLRARVPQRDSLSELAPPSLDWDDPAPVMDSAPPIALYSDEDEGPPEKPASADLEKPPAPTVSSAAAGLRPDWPTASDGPTEPDADAPSPRALEAEPSDRADESPAPPRKHSAQERVSIGHREPAQRGSRSAAPEPRSARSPGFVLVALGLGAVAFGAAFYVGRKLKREEREPPPPAAPSATVSSSLAAPPVASADAEAPPDLRDPRVRAACVASYFPEGTFQGDEDFSFLCNKQDFRGITSLIHRQLVVSSKGRITSGMKEWATLDWYEVGVTAVLRGGCCPADVPAIELPAYAYTGSCEPIAESLVKVGRHPIRPDEAKARAQEFAAEIRCLYVNNVPRPFRYPGQPSGANRLVFEAFLERAAERYPN